MDTSTEGATIHANSVYNEGDVVPVRRDYMGLGRQAVEERVVNHN
jgi:hypothetical protein